MCCPLSRPRMATTTHPLSPMSHRNCPTQQHSCPMLYRDCPMQIHSCPMLYRDCPTQHRSCPMQHFLPQGVIRRCQRSSRPRAYLKVVPQVPDRPVNSPCASMHRKRRVATVASGGAGCRPTPPPTAGDGSSAQLGRFGPATQCARSTFQGDAPTIFGRALGIRSVEAAGREGHRKSV